jgi:transcriptional regulator with XRE-family HTH domain
MSTGKKIRSLREAKKLSLQELAKEAGISFSFLSEIENELKIPSNTIIEKIANALSVDPNIFPIYKVRANISSIARTIDNLDERFVDELLRIIREGEKSRNS